MSSVVFYIAAARMLGESGFGSLMFALSFTTVLFVVSGFGMEDLMAREVSRDRGRIHDYLSNVVAVKVTLTVVLFGAAFVIMALADYPTEVRAAVYLVGLGVSIENFGRTWGAVFQAWERMEFISLVLIVQRLLTAVIGVTILAAGGGLVEVAAVYPVAATVGMVASVWLLRRHIVRPRWTVQTSRWWPLVKAGAPIGLITLLFNVLLKLDQTLLSFLSGGDNREVGLYAAALRLVEATLFVSWSFGAALLPWLARGKGTDGDALADGFEMGQKALAAVLLPVAVVFVLLADPLIGLIYGADYEEAVPSLQLLGAMTFFFGINEFAATALVARDSPGLFTRSLIAMIVVNVGLNLVLIPPMGAEGAALAALVSGIGLAVLGQFFVNRAVGRVRPFRCFSSPLLAAGVAALGIVLVGQRLVPGLIVGSVAYVGTLLVTERLFYPDDFARFRGLVRRAEAR